jgi:UDPglucose 6-dehydrogenase
MKIGIIGLGVVGKTIFKAFKKLNHTCYGIDKHNSDEIIKLNNCEIIYVCLPTNHSIEGLKTNLITKYLYKLNKMKFKGIVAIKSTLNPGDTQKFIRKYKFLKKRICFVPEFLRERCSYKDFTKSHDLLLIGTEDKKNCKKIIKSHGKYPKKISIVNTNEAELIKIFSNAYNAARIVFANSFFELCEKLNVNYSNVLQNYLMRDMSSGKYLECNKNLRGFGGKCLPKDLSALNALTKKNTKKIHFFKNIISQNDKFRITIKK